MKDAAKLNLQAMLEAEQIDWADHCSDGKYMSEIDPEEREQMEQEADLADDKRIEDMRNEEEEREWMDQENGCIEQQKIIDRENREKELEWEAELAEIERRAVKDSSHF